MEEMELEFGQLARHSPHYNCTISSQGCGPYKARIARRQERRMDDEDQEERELFLQCC